MIRIRCLAWTISLSATLAVLMQPAARAQQSTENAPNDGVEVLTRGPVHEAYAEPVDANPQPPPVAPKAPPEPIPELPPDQKPEGDKVEWISGYWSWDVDRKDYIWVSGFWRTAPPGRQWLPGHWQQVDAGWQWVPGLWNAAEKTEVAYVPAPPQAVEERVVPAPGEGYFYNPGVWIYRDGRYMWRAGSWVAYNADYLWVPAHYVWTPAGYVFVEGYWDHALPRRGMLFAPVYVSPNAIVQVNFCLTPRHVICTDFMVGALFVRPCARHYYFGDYYEARYGDLGFVAFVDYRVGGRYHDPLYGFYVHYPPSPTWERDTRALYVGRFRGEIARPPQTFAMQEKLHISVAVSLNEAGHHGFKMETISREQVMAARHVAEERRVVAEERHKVETDLHARGPVRVGDAPRVSKMETTRTVDPKSGSGSTFHPEPSRVGSTGSTTGNPANPAAGTGNHGSPSTTFTPPSSGSGTKTSPTTTATPPPTGSGGKTSATTTSPPPPGSGSRSSSPPGHIPPSKSDPHGRDKDKDKDKEKKNG
jgi:hypothetical protein